VADVHNSREIPSDVAGGKGQYFVFRCKEFVARRNRGIVMPSDHSSSDFDDSAYDLRSRAIRARLYACLLGSQDAASGRLLAFADDLETRADAAERASIAPCLMLA
jgi:hypothetical protein